MGTGEVDPVMVVLKEVDGKPLESSTLELRGIDEPGSVIVGLTGVDGTALEASILELGRTDELGSVTGGLIEGDGRPLEISRLELRGIDELSSVIVGLTEVDGMLLETSRLKLRGIDGPGSVIVRLLEDPILGLREIDEVGSIAVGSMIVEDILLEIPFDELDGTTVELTGIDGVGWLEIIVAETGGTGTTILEETAVEVATMLDISAEGSVECSVQCIKELEMVGVEVSIVMIPESLTLNGSPLERVRVG
jgi:hypothetical protein